MSFRAKITFSVLGWTSRTHTHALSHPPLPLSHLSLSLSLYLSLSHTHMFECFFISRVSATVWKRHWSEEDVCCVFVRRSFQTISFFVFACLWSDRVDWWPHCWRALLTSALLTCTADKRTADKCTAVILINWFCCSKWIELFFVILSDSIVFKTSFFLQVKIFFRRINSDFSWHELVRPEISRRFRQIPEFFASIFRPKTED